MSDAVEFTPVVTQKASKAIYDQIRGRIMAGDLKPGDKLPSERDLMDMIQRSRPTIREALRLLEYAGLIRIVPGGRAIVNEPSITSLQQPLENIMTLQSISDAELFEYRFYIEEMTAEWAAQRRTEEDLEDMRGCIESSRELVDDFDAFLRKEIYFRLLIAEASHNRLAIIMEQVIYNAVVNAMSIALSHRTQEERHRINVNVIGDNQRLYEAIRDRDSRRAREEIYRQSRVFLSSNAIPGPQKADGAAERGA